MTVAALPPYVHSLPRVFLREGEIVFTSRGVVVQTVLGSCVSVTMRDEHSGTAAMCHASLPTAAHDGDRALRYVDRAVDHIARRFKSLGIPGDRLQVKLFGGADMRNAGDRQQFRAVGAWNLQTAVEQLESRGLEIAAKHTGGDAGRRVLFVTNTGEVFVHVLPHSFRDDR